MPNHGDKFFVHVVEFPGDLDLLDGRTEGRVLLEALKLSDVPASYSLVTTRATLEEALGTRLDQAVSYCRRFPIIHLSLHGDGEGSGLRDGHYLQWETLRDLLLPINLRLGGALLVCLSSCFGAAGCRMAMYENEPIPFFALVGHPDSAAWGDSAIGFATFYHRLRAGATIFEAVEAMKAASGDHQFVAFGGANIQENYARFLREARTQEILDLMLGQLPPPPTQFAPGTP